jgi:hypothetical protein
MKRQQQHGRDMATGILHDLQPVFGGGSQYREQRKKLS